MRYLFVGLSLGSFALLSASVPGHAVCAFERATQRADFAAERAMSAQPSSRAYISAAVADSARPTDDTVRDAERKPADLIAFAGIEPGDRVADLMPGGGYFTRLFSKVVGPKGHVYAVLPESFASKVPPEKLKPIQALVNEPAYSGNTSLETRPYERLDLGEPLDVVWTSQNYHDVYGAVSVFSVSRSTGPDTAEHLDEAVFNALKPGGLYIIVDHAARPGSGGQDANTLHRIDPATVITQVQTAGFVLEAQSYVLNNPHDAHDKVAFAPEIKGHTDRFVLKFRKPLVSNPTSAPAAPVRDLRDVRT